MSAITFDTHKFVKDLRDAGVPEPQAEAFVRVQQEILSQTGPLKQVKGVRPLLLSIALLLLLLLIASIAIAIEQ